MILILNEYNINYRIFPNIGTMKPANTKLQKWWYNTIINVSKIGYFLFFLLIALFYDNIKANITLYNPIIKYPQYIAQNII